MNEYIIFGAVAALIVGVGIYSIIRNSKIRKNGVEADAIVSRIEEDGTASSEGGADYTDIYCVTFSDQNGQTVEARLNSQPGHTRVGDSVRIKYLPEKPHFAVIVKGSEQMQRRLDRTAEPAVQGERRLQCL